MSFPIDRKPTPEEAVIVLIEAGYEVAKPGSGGIPKKWMDIVKLILPLLTILLASYTAGDLATRPNAATPEQVKEVVKEQTPAIAAEVRK